MSKNRKKSGTEKKRPSAAEQTLTPAQKVAREDLGDFVGISMGEGEKPEAKEAAAREGAGDSLGEVLLAVEEDRTRLLVQGIAYLLLAFFGLFLVLGGIGATQIAQNVAYLTLVVVGLPVAWFSSKAMGRRLGKFARHVGVVEPSRCPTGTSRRTSSSARAARSGCCSPVTGSPTPRAFTSLTSTAPSWRARSTPWRSRSWGSCARTT